MSLTPPRVHRLGTQTPSSHALVFIHGLEDDWRSFTPVVPHLAGFDVYSVDLPWRSGNTYEWRWDTSPSGWVSAALHQLPHEQISVVGHSFGANALLEHLARDPNPRVRSATLAMPFYRPAGSHVSWRAFEVSRDVFAQQIRSGIHYRMGDRAASVRGDILEGMFAKTAERIGPIGFLAVFEQYVASGYLPLAEVTVPTLVLTGERDVGHSSRELDALTSALACPTLRCEPDFDHFCHLTHAQEFAELVMMHVASTSSAPT